MQCDLDGVLSTVVDVGRCCWSLSLEIVPFKISDKYPTNDICTNKNGSTSSNQKGITA